ncbi:hypothetical protein DPMN_089707 [Dreissena polymorpha]|nr:hypothetical protein DPMN_089707 [Dreissena polymorpha]
MCLYKLVCVFILTTATVKGIVYLGCYKDSRDKRVLSIKLPDSDKNTPEECARRCSQYRYAGVEFKRLCFCGDVLTQTNQLETECREKCSGNRSEICGDSWWISVYTNWACGPPPAIANGNTTLHNGTNVRYGLIADVHCSPGFIGKPNITCFSNTSWEITTCEQSG